MNSKEKIHRLLRVCCDKLLAYVRERGSLHGDRRVSATELKDNLDLNLVPWEKGTAAAKAALAQFKSKQPVDTICPSCRRAISVTYVPAPADSFVTICQCHKSNRTFRGVLGPPDWILAERQQYVQKAANLGVLDATFFATYFNECKQGDFFECPIDPLALSSDASGDVVDDAILRSRRLHHGLNAYVGAAFFKYPGEELTYEEAVEKLKRDNPGFCKAVYGVVINDNIRGMR